MHFLSYLVVSNPYLVPSDAGVLCGIAHICKKKNDNHLCFAIIFCFLVEYLALAGLMNFFAQLSDRIHHFTVYNLMPLAFLTKWEGNFGND